MLDTITPAILVGGDEPSVNGGRPARLVVAHQSAAVREMLTERLRSVTGIVVTAVVGTAGSALEAVRLHEADVVLLDLDLPRVDAPIFVGLLLRTRPVRVVGLSALDEAGGHAALDALEQGAVAVVHVADEDDVAATVQAAVGARIQPVAPRIDRRPLRGIGQAACRWPVVLVGGAMGSVGSLERLIQAMPADAPPTVAVVPLPEQLTPILARDLERCSAVRVREARAGDVIVPGHVLLAPGDRHIRIAPDGDGLRVELDAGHRVHSHRPSLDALFTSAARALHHNALGVILSGEGEDGASGLQALHEAGAVTLSEDPTRCVAADAPLATILRGAVDQVASPEEILDLILGQDLARREAA